MLGAGTKHLWGLAGRDGVAAGWMVTTGDLRALGELWAKISHIQNLSISQREVTAEQAPGQAVCPPGNMLSLEGN